MPSTTARNFSDTAGTLEKNGTLATYTCENDSWETDGEYWEYTVLLSFDDPHLNPPQKSAWVAGEFTVHYKTDPAQLCHEYAEQFYDFLMNFRTEYGKETRINEFRLVARKAEARVEAVEKEKAQLEQQLQNSHHRIRELSTDHVTKVEKRNEQLTQQLAQIKETLKKLISSF